MRIGAGVAARDNGATASVIAVRVLHHGNMASDGAIQELLRPLVPKVLGALIRRYGGFEACEDAVQEALLAAAIQWPGQGVYPMIPRAGCSLSRPGGWPTSTAATWPADGGRPRLRRWCRLTSPGSQARTPIAARTKTTH